MKNQPEAIKTEDKFIAEKLSTFKDENAQTQEFVENFKGWTFDQQQDFLNAIPSMKVKSEIGAALQSSFFEKFAALSMEEQRAYIVGAIASEKENILWNAFERLPLEEQVKISNSGTQTGYFLNTAEQNKLLATMSPKAAGRLFEKLPNKFPSYRQTSLFRQMSPQQRGLMVEHLDPKVAANRIQDLGKQKGQETFARASAKAQVGMIKAKLQAKHSRFVSNFVTGLPPQKLSALLLELNKPSVPENKQEDAKNLDIIRGIMNDKTMTTEQQINVLNVLGSSQDRNTHALRKTLFASAAKKAGGISFGQKLKILLHPGTNNKEELLSYLSPADKERFFREADASQGQIFYNNLRSIKDEHGNMRPIDKAKTLNDLSKVKRSRGKSNPTKLFLGDHPQNRGGVLNELLTPGDQYNKELALKLVNAIPEAEIGAVFSRPPEELTDKNAVELFQGLKGKFPNETRGALNKQTAALIAMQGNPKRSIECFKSISHNTKRQTELLNRISLDQTKTIFSGLNDTKLEAKLLTNKHKGKYTLKEHVAVACINSVGCEKRADIFGQMYTDGGNKFEARDYRLFGSQDVPGKRGTLQELLRKDNKPAAHALFKNGQSCDLSSKVKVLSSLDHDKDPKNYDQNQADQKALFNDALNQHEQAELLSYEGEGQSPALRNKLFGNLPTDTRRAEVLNSPRMKEHVMHQLFGAQNASAQSAIMLAKNGEKNNEFVLPKKKAQKLFNHRAFESKRHLLIKEMLKSGNSPDLIRSTQLVSGLPSVKNRVDVMKKLESNEQFKIMTQKEKGKLVLSNKKAKSIFRHNEFSQQRPALIKEFLNEGSLENKRRSVGLVLSLNNQAKKDFMAHPQIGEGERKQLLDTANQYGKRELLNACYKTEGLRKESAEYIQRMPHEQRASLLNARRLNKQLAVHAFNLLGENEKIDVINKSNFLEGNGTRFAIAMCSPGGTFDPKKLAELMSSGKIHDPKTIIDNMILKGQWKNVNSTMAELWKTDKGKELVGKINPLYASYARLKDTLKVEFTALVKSIGSLITAIPKAIAEKSFAPLLEPFKGVAVASSNLAKKLLKDGMKGLSQPLMGIAKQTTHALTTSAIKIKDNIKEKADEKKADIAAKKEAQSNEAEIFSKQTETQKESAQESSTPVTQTGVSNTPKQEGSSPGDSNAPTTILKPEVKEAPSRLDPNTSTQAQTPKPQKPADNAPRYLETPKQNCKEGTMHDALLEKGFNPDAYSKPGEVIYRLPQNMGGGQFSVSYSHDKNPSTIINVDTNSPENNEALKQAIQVLVAKNPNINFQLLGPETPSIKKMVDSLPKNANGRPSNFIIPKKYALKEPEKDKEEQKRLEQPTGTENNANELEGQKMRAYK